jgi:hypothetical protein
MSNIEKLISRLQEQFDQHADPEKLLATVNELRDELAGQAQPRPARTLGTSKVAVVMPSGIMPSAYEKYAPQPEMPVREEKETVLVDKGSVAIVQDNGQLDMVFDPMTEIPTLSQQVKDKKREQGQEESLNDKLKQGKTELLEVLKETPIKDLRKAIGINDRFLFINDLFRGDEAMYERSIKTINSFNIYHEAEYWINRELKVKIGWDNENRTVQHFDQLVKRRFS